MAVGEPVQECRAGLISPEVALARLLLAGLSVARIEALLDQPADREMRRLVQARRAAMEKLVVEVAETVANHTAAADTPEQGIARIAAFFDRAVAHSPEASVALYSLGDPAILAAATAEIVGWLEAQRVLRRDADVLDLGCGFGRVAAVLAQHSRSVLGLDVSAGMVAEARRRNTAANVQFAQTDGMGLGGLADAGFDVVLAIDSFPYIVQAGLAPQIVGEAARVLRPGGALAILNLSYRDDAAQDLADAMAWAAAHGFALERAEPSPFRLWDGSAYILRR